MESLVLHQFLLAGLFFLITVVYASVGLGGGSAYTALMAITGVSYMDIPTISLFLNIVVTLLTSFSFLKGGHGRLNLMLPLLLTSIPAAFAGGMLDVPARMFEWILLVSLVLVAVRIYLFSDDAFLKLPGIIPPTPFSIALGLVFGLVSGIVGIGGGIYLIPVIRMFNLGTMKEAATAGGLFTLANSISGFTSRIQFHGLDVLSILPLVFAVLAGGVIGGYFGAFRFSPGRIQKILGGIILVAILFLIVRIML